MARRSYLTIKERLLLETEVPNEQYNHNKVNVLCHDKLKMTIVLYAQQATYLLIRFDL